MAVSGLRSGSGGRDGGLLQSMRKLRTVGVPMIDYSEKHERDATFLPTPEQIAAGCREIQLEWSESEKRRRCLASNGAGDSWNLPVCREGASGDE